MKVLVTVRMILVIGILTLAGVTYFNEKSQSNLFETGLFQTTISETMDKTEDIGKSNVKTPTPEKSLPRQLKLPFKDYLTSRDFVTAQDIIVHFSPRSANSGQISIRNKEFYKNKSMLGLYKVIHDMVFISELSIVSGTFDASVNHDFSGTGKLDVNGNLSLYLSDGYGHEKELLCRPTK